MRFRLLPFLLLAVFFILPWQANAQEELSLKDAVRKQWSTFYPDRVWGLQWVKGEDAFVYHQLEDDGLYLVRQTVKGGEAQKLFSVEDLNAALGTGVKRIPSLDWQTSSSFVLHAGDGFYSYDVAKKSGMKLFQHDENAEHLEHAPDYSGAAYTVDNNLYYQPAKGKAVQVTKDKDPGIISGQAVHRFEFGISKGIFWSPKSDKVAFYRKDETMVTDYPTMDISTTPASLKMIKYPMAGQKSHHASVGVYDVKSGKTTYLKTGEPKELYLTCVTWSPDGKSIFIATVNRDQNHVKLNMYDAASGDFVRTLFEEKDEKYVEPEHELTFLPNKPDQFLWWSERDGFNHLYLYNTSGKLIRQVTKGNWEVENLIGFDPKGRFLYLVGTANDGLDRQIYRVGVAKGKAFKVTKMDGTYSGQLSANGRYLLTSFSNLTTPREQHLIHSNGSTIRTIHKADNPLKNYAVGTTELFSIDGVDENKLQCRMIKPSNFDPSKKYPVFVYVYGGPRAQMVTNTWLGGARLWMHWMAEQGYIVFTLDNRGSENRGIAFEQAVFRNLGKYEMEDQLLGVKHLKSLPYVDGDRMAVHGWSFGGYMTTTLMLKSPETFKVGVAGGPVTDWAYYEIMYGEKYMDHPDDNPEGYEYGRLKNYVKDLQGDLLLIHGSIDDVVVLQHNYALLEACVKNDVQVDYFVYPGHKHNVIGKDRFHLMEKVLTYVIDKLED